jgi:hypothetical protein
MKIGFLAKGADFGGVLPFYFNLSHPVGKGYPNAPFDDVGFVQLCFAVLGQSTAAPMPNNIKVPWSKVKVTGHMDESTQAAIDAWQQDRRARYGSKIDVDGIFSVAPPIATNYAKDTPYSIVGVNFLMMMATLAIWPRLDKHPLAGPVAEPIRKAISSELTA